MGKISKHARYSRRVRAGGLGLRGYARNMVWRARRRAKLKGIEFSIDPEAVIERVVRGRCEATGVPFRLENASRSPWRPTIDRIDNSLGYSMDNIQITCLMYNYSKNVSGTHGDVVRMCRFIEVQEYMAWQDGIIHSPI